ncbi:hypothetical protein [Halalkalibacter krulwichiae]|uniref:Uncharacterized protein n=1 Tax=Halalkalibacter krulwichiae TaxID=199441 RepID=A0A1X9MBJ3_9BACI|nr:hypothetical protein [Halalkalibacter krulwichiae]ARK30786.1 hypothetical protein BkAM31D_13595 [Halalkalibacter krulwichiae]
MLLTFQVLLFIFMILFGLGAIGETDKDRRINFTAITIASIGAMCFGFWVG